jgi:hypothetical protein
VVKRFAATSDPLRHAPAARAPETSTPLAVARVLALQATAGNQAVVARLRDDAERTGDALVTIAGVNARLAAEIPKHAAYAAAVPCLSMSGLSEDTTKGKRSLVRAATLTYLTVGGRAIADADAIKAKLKDMDKAALRLVLQRWVPADVLAEQTGRSSFPALGATSTEKAAWEPEGFSDPAAHRVGKPFRYIVIALQSQSKDKNRAYTYKDFLKTPGILENFMNSTSVIDESHRGTYTPYGFILRVPAANVEIASTKDIAIANQSGDIERETEGKYAMFGLPEPGELLESMAAPRDPKNLRYNEVVVRGRSGEGAIKVTAIFLKTQGGELARPYTGMGEDRRAKDSYVNEALMKEIRTAAAALQVPIVYIDEDDPSQDTLEGLDEESSAESSSDT